VVLVITRLSKSLFGQSQFEKMNKAIILFDSGERLKVDREVLCRSAHFLELTEGKD
jgi:hypothetical protein